MIMKQQKKTKIIATIGPSSTNAKLLERMIRGGMNIARMNFSHGDFTEHYEKLKLVRNAAKKLGKYTAIMQDLGGPKIRTGDLADEFVILKKGAEIILTTKKVVGTVERMSVNYKGLPKDVKVGHRILLNDGKQELVVKKVKGTEIYCKIRHGGKVAGRRGINLPDTILSLSAFTAKDKRDLEFGLKHNVEFVALSFVQTASDVRALKRVLKKRGSSAMVVTKIETSSAIANLDEILEVTDAIMVARGDLAVEVGAEKVPMLQKEMVKKANKLSKPVIVATQMLESMTESPVPTRAEVSDVANAILDGADAVMLSGETAMGNFPLETVETMANIAQDTEDHMKFTKRLNKVRIVDTCEYTNEAVAHHAAQIAADVSAKVVVALTETGASARMIAKFRIKQPILVMSRHESTLRQTSILFGAVPARMSTLRIWSDVMKLAARAAENGGLAKSGDKIVVVSGSIFGKPGETNTLTVVSV